MEKQHRLFFYLLLLGCLCNVGLHGHTLPKTRMLVVSSNIFATPIPTGIYDRYYCLNDTPVALTANFIAGASENWYTTKTGGTATSTRPTPATSVKGATAYYVSQTVGGEESGRAEIIVNVDKQFALFCASRTTNSVFFDFANVGQSRFDYSYTIDGGAPVIGTQTAPSSLTVGGLSEGQTVVLTVTAFGARSCVLNPTLTDSCKTLCTTTTTPNFAQIPPICSGDTPPVLGNTSPNGITGTWAPSTVSNTVSGSYVFTPNTTTFRCATTQTLAVVVNPKATPSFTTIPATVCQNATAPVLPLNSNNTPVISGTWSPSTVDTSVLGPVTYTFIPNSGQCVVAAKTTATITVQANTAPNFAAIPAICSGNAVPVLANTSPNGIIGAWAPATINNTNSGSYVFTPTAGQCATTQTLNVSITPRIVPNFAPIASFCEGTIAPILDNNMSSPNGVSGTWSPAVISNSSSGSYVFTPGANQCATTQTLNVTVNPRTNPGFISFSICSGSIPPMLKTTSPNGINGTWSPAVIDNMNSGTYDFMPDSNQCANPERINITVIPSNTLSDFQWTVTEAFSANQMITVTAEAAGGNYLYQLDDGPFQATPVFENVSSGYHSVTVADIGGCSVPITKLNILVIGYPKYFTPNADGYNDKWNIFELEEDAASKIHIFDRYGKLLKEIRPNGNGWDGTYNGREMPGNDYWFVVEYQEGGILKKYRSHFSLKR